MTLPFERHSCGDEDTVMIAQRFAHDHVVTIRFALGSLISVAAWSATMLGHVLGPAALLLPCIGFFVGGAVAGTALRQSLGAAVGFGVAFAIGNTASVLSIIGTQAMTGREFLLVQFAVSYSIVFGIAGLTGLLSAGMRGRPLLIGVLGFAGGGFTTAILVVSLLNVHLIGGSTVRAVMGYTIPMTLPWVGGVVITRALNDEQRNIHLRSDTSANLSR